MVLTTKLYIPPPRPNVVRRPRLLERLNDGLHHKLTLISAPAGFGKTTLVSAWLAECKRSAAWLSLDEGDNDTAQFLTYLIAALQTTEANIGEGVLRALQSPQPLPTEELLTALLNDLTSIRYPLVVVLDDYHLIEAQPVDQVLTYLVEHLPPKIHLVLATREDPQLPLARLRARGHMTQLRASDLRFTPAEAAAFLHHGMDLQLSAADISRLADRTEGWIAGLQLAALSLQGHQDASGFIHAFAGDHRYIMDYLVAEVLQRQPEPVRRFLLQTSILERLQGPLCDAVTGQAESSARLEALERGNFFVVPLDDKRQWYRYHHLFAEGLCAQLRAEEPEQVATLHRRASAWYEQQGAAAEAIRHALAAQDLARAADLIEMAVPALHRSKQEATLLGWLAALPNELVHCRPVLSVGYAWAFLASGELEAAELRLRDAERWLEPLVDPGERDCTPPAKMVVVDHEEFRRLPATIAVYRAAHAQALGDVASTAYFARRALDLVAADDELRHGAATALLGLASWTSGDLESAYQAFAAGMAQVQRAGNLADVISGTIALGEIRIGQGRLHEARRTYERAVQLAQEQGAPVPRGTADLYVGLSELQREHNELPSATQLLLRSQELGEQASLAQNRSRWYVVMAHIREAQGDLEGALDLLEEAERRYIRDFFPTVRPVGAHIARVWVAQGRVGEALSWAREQGLNASDEVSYLREFEHLTLARVLVARSTSDRTDRSLREALGLLERLLSAAEAGHRTGSVLDILVLQALAHQTHGDLGAALVALGRALRLAEPEGYVRLFVDEGALMADLLRKAAAYRIMPEYASRLLAACGTEQEWNTGESLLSATSTATHALIEPLTQRELDVLRLLNSTLSGPEIADALVIALSTVHSHTKSIYGKLNVTNRRAAVKRAAELHLI